MVTTASTVQEQYPVPEDLKPAMVGAGGNSELIERAVEDGGILGRSSTHARGHLEVPAQL